MLETPIYEFNGQWSKGEQMASALDVHYSKKYEVKRVAISQERIGIDRLMTDRKTGIQYSVEYKSDFLAASTGYIFVETMSVDKDNKRGWAYTMCAQLLYYYIPELKTVYKIQGLTLKHYIPIWAKQYETRAVKNKDYFTHGLLVPIDVFESACYGKDTIQ